MCAWTKRMPLHCTTWPDPGCVVAAGASGLRPLQAHNTCANGRRTASIVSKKLGTVPYVKCVLDGLRTGVTCKHRRLRMRGVIRYHLISCRDLRQAYPR